MCHPSQSFLHFYRKQFINMKEITSNGSMSSSNNLYVDMVFTGQRRVWAPPAVIHDWPWPFYPMAYRAGEGPQEGKLCLPSAGTLPPWQVGWCLLWGPPRSMSAAAVLVITPLTPKCPSSLCEFLAIFFSSQDEHANLSPLSASHQALVHSLALFMKVYINQLLPSFIKFLFWSTHSL